GNADRLQGAELFQILDGEDVERLAGNHGADNQRDSNRDSKVDWNTGVLQIVDNRLPGETRSGDGMQPRLLVDSPAKFRNRYIRLALHQDEGELVALAADELDRLAVTREHDRGRQERRGRFRDPDDPDRAVIQFQGSSDRERLAGKEEVVA